MFSLSNSNRTAAQFREELASAAKKFALRRHRARKHIEEGTVNMTPMERLQHHINRIQRKRDNFLYKNRNPKDELSERIANFRAYKQYKNALTAFSRRRKILVSISIQILSIQFSSVFSNCSTIHCFQNSLSDHC